ncbi:MAG: endonuclease/exonuclease/phosphatase family protein [Acidobacteria bacterium]|nr:endonuclease/exonuclease/phosphatase family protein [Acidobacteriota bacterium]
MLNKLTSFLLGLALVCTLGLTPSPLLAAGSSQSQKSAHSKQAEREFTVMTQNLYLGADLAPLFGQSGVGLVQAAGAAYAHMVQTDFPSRAQAIANLIVEKSPDIVGLQEVSLWQTAPYNLLSPPDSPPQFEVTYDFLAILLAALAERGHPYRAVAANVNISQALPISFTTLASYTDRDVIIVRDDLPTSQLKVSNPTSQNFQAALPVPLNGDLVFVPRGWSTVDVKLRGKSYRFANTHLEAYSPIVRNFQAQELAASLAASPLPVVLVGDLNSTPDDSIGAYGIMLGAGFIDSWVEAAEAGSGFTSGQSEDLNNPTSQLSERIDYVLHTAGTDINALPDGGDVVGEELTDRVLSAFNQLLWPADHAGVVFRLHLAKP